MNLEQIKQRESVFWSRTKKEGNCILWIAGKMPNGYGSFRVCKKTITAHRYSYLLNKGKIKSGLCVCHSCDNKLCVNPDHLFLGTLADNIADKVDKNRQAKGTKVNTNILTESEVLEIKQLRATHTLKELGQKYGVHSTTIAKITCGKNWKYLC